MDTSSYYGIGTLSDLLADDVVFKACFLAEDHGVVQWVLSWLALLCSSWLLRLMLAIRWR